MPELPDLAIVADAFHAALAGRSITSTRALAPLAVRGTPAELEALVGQQLRSIRRRGKLLLVELDRDRIVVNPMLTGRFQLAVPSSALPTKTALVVGFGSRARGPRDAARWTARAPWLPALGASVEVRYRDPTQMGKVYASGSFRFFETYSIVAYIYLILTIGLSLALRALEQHLRQNTRR